MTSEAQYNCLIPAALKVSTSTAAAPRVLFAGTQYLVQYLGVFSNIRAGLPGTCRRVERGDQALSA